MDLRSQILHRLAMKGLAEEDELAAEFEVPNSRVESELEKLGANGSVENEGFWYVTDSGEERLNRSLRERFTAEQIEEIQREFEDFEDLDVEFKELASEWQRRDRDTPEEELVDQLGELHRRLESFFERFGTEIRTEYQIYLHDLASALDELQAGDEEYFTGSEVDSYHTVWFRLHDDLLRTLGIERDE